MRRLAKWFDSRTGVYDVIQHALYENIPSGARWRYITGSMLVFAFAVQAITQIGLSLISRKEREVSGVDQCDIERVLIRRKALEGIFRNERTNDLLLVGVDENAMLHFLCPLLPR